MEAAEEGAQAAAPADTLGAVVAVVEGGMVAVVAREEEGANGQCYSSPCSCSRCPLSLNKSGRNAQPNTCPWTRRHKDEGTQAKAVPTAVVGPEVAVVLVVPVEKVVGVVRAGAGGVSASYQAPPPRPHHHSLRSPLGLGREETCRVVLRRAHSQPRRQA